MQRCAGLTRAVLVKVGVILRQPRGSSSSASPETFAPLHVAFGDRMPGVRKDQCIAARVPCRAAGGLPRWCCARFCTPGSRGALNAPVAPTNSDFSEACAPPVPPVPRLCAATPASPGRSRRFRDQFPMPGQQRRRRDNRGHFLQHLPSQSLGLGGQPPMWSSVNRKRRSPSCSRPAAATRTNQNGSITLDIWFNLSPPRSQDLAIQLDQVFGPYGIVGLCGMLLLPIQFETKLNLPLAGLCRAGELAGR